MRVKNTRFALLAAALGTLISLPPAYADEDEGYFEGETTEALSRRLSIGIAG
ncbi:MAG: hypothetical protein GWP64_04800, partial [Gammaproteobacteria bacterium]|nr:hypothetical protein [Gammaproteobacteria bacterium]